MGHFHKCGRRMLCLILGCLTLWMLAALPVSAVMADIELNESDRLAATVYYGPGERYLAVGKLEKGEALTVLDELNVALACGMVTRENAERLIDAALAFGDVVSTGRNAPEWLREKGDYVSEIVARKHPFQTEKLAAREGIEY